MVVEPVRDQLGDASRQGHVAGARGRLRRLQTIDARKFVADAEASVAQADVAHPEAGDLAVAQPAAARCTTAMFSLSFLLRPMSQNTGWSVTGLSTAMRVGFLAMAVASMIWGRLSDKFGPRPVLLCGA